MSKWDLKVYLKIIKAPNITPHDSGMLVCTKYYKNKKIFPRCLVLHETLYNINSTWQRLNKDLYYVTQLGFTIKYDHTNFQKYQNSSVCKTVVLAIKSSKFKKKENQQVM